MIEYFLPILFIICGGLLLGYGAEALVKGASALAHHFGISPLVIGMTVVAMGTSAPELATSLIGGGEIALGNVAGSNLMNVGLILGMTAIMYPLKCEGNFLRFELPVMVLSGPLLLLLAWNGLLSWIEGTIFLTCLVLFVFFSIKRGRIDPLAMEFVSQVEKSMTLSVALGMVLIGGIGLTGGGKLLVDGAVDLATLFGLPTRLIAVTLVAGGTSLPELATCLVAARKSQGDIALGNIVGSNIFNILGILGAVSILRPIQVTREALLFDFPAVIIIQFLCIPIMLTRLKVARWEGAILLVFYLAYLVVVFTVK